MTIRELNEMNLPDDTEVQINSVYDKDINDLRPVSCSGFYHENDKKVYLTPDAISLGDDNLEKKIRDLIQELVESLDYAEEQFNNTEIDYNKGIYKLRSYGYECELNALYYLLGEKYTFRHKPV